MEVKTTGGGTLLTLKGRKLLYKEWLDKKGVNDFLKRAQNTARFRELAVEKLSAVLGLLMVEEEEKLEIAEEHAVLQETMDGQKRKLLYIQDLLAVEEDAKRRMLLRYVHILKEFSSLSLQHGGEGGVIQMPESNICDEEVHALSALLKNNVTVKEINLRGNNIGDDGARSLCAVLSAKSALRLVDLRGNRIGKGAIKIIAEVSHT
jgi:myosin protein heavy chain